MAKGAYIGIADIARKIKKGYIGVNGIAKKIKKAYVGDESGRARLCYMAQTEWERYEAVSQTKYEVVKKTDGESGSMSSGNYYIEYQNSWGTYLTFKCGTGYTFNEDNGRFSLTNARDVYYTSSAIDGTLDNDSNYFQGSNTQYVFQRFLNTYADAMYFQIRYSASKVNIYSKGSYIDTVASDNENAYPDDGYQDGYWYVKKQ